MTVSTVAQHHEGGGKPRTVDLSHAGYSYGIFGGGQWAWWRQPDDPRGPGFHDFATAGYNGRVMSVVLTGDRNVYPVTADDHQAMREIADHARAHGYLVAAPAVFAHRQFPPPNRTACAGSHVGPALPAKNLPGDNLAWIQIVGCYHKEAVPMPPGVIPEMWPAVDDVVDACAFGPSLEHVAVLSADGHVWCPKGGYVGSPYDDATGQPKAYWKLPDGRLRGGAKISGGAHGYTITSTQAGDKGFTYPEQ